MESSAALRRFPRPAPSALLLRVASDERLVEHVRGGSEAAFEALYDRHHRQILAFCRHMLGSPEEAEDAVQHTFMAAYRHLVGGTAEIQLRPWLYTIARNRCLSMLRTRRERPLGEWDEPATDNLSAEAQRRSDVRELLGDVAQLPDDQRAALVLAELGAVSHDEIAEVLGVPRQKVKALVFQARSSLAASRKARETPCAEIREQLANLRGGALRRTTLHRHLRECPGCREFRDEVSRQRKTMAVALPVVPSIGLKEAALGAAFGSGGAGGGAAAVSGGGALAAKALVAVALVGGGTTATVVTHEAGRTPSAHAGAKPAAAAPAAIAGERQLTTGPWQGAGAGPRDAADGRPSDATRRARGEQRAKGDKAAGRHGASGAAAVPHGQAKGKSVPPGQAKPRNASRGGSGTSRRAVVPGQTKLKPVAPGQIRKTTGSLPKGNHGAAVGPLRSGGDHAGGTAGHGRSEPASALAPELKPHGPPK